MEALEFVGIENRRLACWLVGLVYCYMMIPADVCALGAMILSSDLWQTYTLTWNMHARINNARMYTTTEAVLCSRYAEKSALKCLYLNSLRVVYTRKHDKAIPHHVSPAV